MKTDVCLTCAICQPIMNEMEDEIYYCWIEQECVELTDSCDCWQVGLN